MIRPTALIVALLFARGASATEFTDVVATYGNLQTVAGNGGNNGDNGNNYWNAATMEGGAAVDAELSRPHMTMADRDGNLYIADKFAHAIRKVTTDGTIHAIAGTNAAGFNGDGLGTSVQLNQPNGLFTFPDGTTYILDLMNGLIRRLGTDGQLTTIIDDPLGMGVSRSTRRF